MTGVLNIRMTKQLETEVRNWERCGYTLPTITDKVDKLEQLRYALMTGLDMSWVDVENTSADKLSIIRQALGYGMTKEQIQEADSVNNLLFLGRALERGITVEDAMSWLNDHGIVIDNIERVNDYIYCLEYDIDISELVNTYQTNFERLLPSLVRIHRWCTNLDMEIDPFLNLLGLAEHQLRSFIITAKLTNTETPIQTIDNKLNQIIDYSPNQRAHIVIGLWLGLDMRNIINPEYTEYNKDYRRQVLDKVTPIVGLDFKRITLEDAMLEHIIQQMSKSLWTLKDNYYSAYDTTICYSEYGQAEMLNLLAHENGYKVYDHNIEINMTDKNKMIIDTIRHRFTMNIRRGLGDTYYDTPKGIRFQSLKNLPGFEDFVEKVHTRGNKTIVSKVLTAYTQGYDPDELLKICFESKNKEEVWFKIKELDVRQKSKENKQKDLELI